MTTITPATSHPTAPVPVPVPVCDPATPSVQTLLSAVRRHLWRRQFAAAARMAAWASAGLTLLAATVHVAAHAVPWGAVGAATGLLWSALLVRAVLRRPADRPCALWADQHLGGASAFTTLLDTGQGVPGRNQAPAVRWLEAWATVRVPTSLRQLAASRDEAHLARPLLSMAVCAALASLVLTLPGPPPTQPRTAASTLATLPQAALRLADAPEPAVLAGEIAAALRAAPSREAESPGGADRRPPLAGPARGEDANAPAVAAPGPAPAGARPADKPVQAAAVNGASLARAGGAADAGGGGGREAGDSADARAGTGVSRALRGTMGLQDWAPAAGPASAQRRAHADQVASYESDESDESQTRRRQPAASHNQPAPAAATPPPATGSTRLTPTQASYVQAWMKASERAP